MSSSESEKEIETEIIFEAVEISSGEDPPKSEWSSLEVEVEEENKKRLLHAEGLYAPGSGEVCAKYIAQSDSDVFRHVYYNYPAVQNPGIKRALFKPEVPTIYGDDGMDLYMVTCKEMNICPIRSFYRGLLSSNINLSYYGINVAGVRAIAMALQYNKFVKKLDLTDNFLNGDACYHLGQMFNANVTLQELNLTGCRIRATGLYRLGDTLHENKTLLDLNLSRNDIGENGGIYYAKMLEKGVAVKRVNLSKNCLGKLTALAFGQVFEYRDAITNLDLSWNNFYHMPSTAKMLDMLSNSTILEELNLSWNSLEGEKVAESIGKVLRIPTLMVLNLSNNRFAGEAAVIISSSLIKAKKLITLDLSSNPFSPSDAVAVLEKMLRSRVKLENLMLGSIWVNQKFLVVLNKVKNMKSRKNFVVVYEGVLADWIVKGPDARELILKRADYLGKLNKRNKIDVVLYFLALNKEYEKPIPVKALIERLDADGVALNEDLINELAVQFPGSKSAKMKSVNMKTLCEYLQRIWPYKKLPPTPPPETEPEPNPDPETKTKKGKKKKK